MKLRVRTHIQAVFEHFKILVVIWHFLFLTWWKSKKANHVVMWHIQVTFTRIPSNLLVDSTGKNGCFLKRSLPYFPASFLALNQPCTFLLYNYFSAIINLRKSLQLYHFVHNSWKDLIILYERRIGIFSFFFSQRETWHNKVTMTWIYRLL